MSLLTTAGSGGSILRPEAVQSLVIEPLIRQATSTQISSVVQTLSHDARFPIVVADPTTKWTAEGAEIDVTDADIHELVCTPKKLAGLTIVSNELANDSDPSALEVVGSGLVRDLQLRLDSAYFGDTVSEGPAGLLSLAGVQHVDLGSGVEDLDAFAEAISLAETVGAVVTSFVASPATVLALSTLKTETASLQPLLGPDATSPTKRSVLGVPLHSSPAIEDDVVWAIPAAKVFVVIRQNASVAVDSSAYFSSDRLGVRCTLRAAFAFPHEAAIVKLSIGGS